MGMEGISWEGINSEASKITQYSDEFAKDIYDASQKLLDELCKVWGSGNAIKFGNDFADAVQYDTNMIIEINGKLIDKLIEAAKIYSETFNVEVSISKTEGTKAEKIDHNIQEKVNGTTGMDKEYVRNLISEYQKDVNDFCNMYEASINNISVSLFDTAGIQKETFSRTVEFETKMIKDNLTKLTTRAKYEIEKEISALAAAQRTVTNSFDSSVLDAINGDM